jgi:hypothetical protein
MPEYVLLGGPPYEESANQTSLQLFNELGKTNRVLYVCRRHQSSAIRRLFRCRGCNRDYTSSTETVTFLSCPWLVSGCP